MKRLAIGILAVIGCGLGSIIHVPGEYPTIQAGIDAAGPGDIVLVAAGTYPEEINLKASVTVRGAGTGRSIIDGGGNPGDVVRAVGNAIGPDTKLEGFTITGAVNGGGMPGGGGIFCNSGAKPDIGNCLVTGNDQGIALWNGSSASIHNCVVTKNTYDGISVGCYATVVNNTIHANRIGFYDNSGYGPLFMNNIVTGHSLFGIYGPSGGSPPTLTYNDVWGNATNYQQATPGIGSISRDPMFVDTAALDFHLSPGSPCIDSGNPAPQYNDPDGTRNDMGAFGGPAAPSARFELTLLVPAPNELNVELEAEVQAGFSKAVNPATLDRRSFTLRGSYTGTVPAVLAYDSVAKVATLSPATALCPGEPATVTLSRGIRSLSGDTFPGCSWSFATAVDGGSGRFSDTSSFAAGSGPTHLLCADLDNDNFLDLVQVCDGSDQLAVRLGNGDGTFDPPAWFAAGTGPRAAVAADFDSDSVIDLAAGNYGSNSVSVFMGRGGGDFDPAVNYPAGSAPTALAVADLDSDGDLDLSVACFAADSVAVLSGNGDGTFAVPVRFPAGDGPNGIAAGDLNNDGFPDLVSANLNSNDLAVLLGSGTGSFTSRGRYATGSAPYSVTLGDFWQDGVLDAAVPNSGASTVSVLFGDGSGAFTGRDNYLTGGSPRFIAAADCNADGVLDLAVTNKTGNSLSVLFGIVSGMFGTAVQWPSGADPLSLAAGDLDNDGDIDLCVGRYSGIRIAVLKNDDRLAVIATEPDPHEVAVPDTTSPRATFNLRVQSGTLDSTSFICSGSLSGAYRGPIRFDTTSLVAVLDPRVAFAPGEYIFTTLTPDILGANGTNLAGFTWSFVADVGTASSGAFGSTSSFPTGGEPRGTVLADFDGDGDVDVVTTANSPAAACLLRNDGSGAFAAPEYTNVAGDPISVFAADLDADADVDLVVFHNEPGTSHLEVLKNDGGGNFSVAHSYTPAVLGQCVSGADLDSDGDCDVVLTDGWGSQNNVKVLLNDGTGALGSPTSYSAGSWARGIAITDVEEDGDMDLCIANAGNNNVTVLWNDGAAHFPRMANFDCGSSPEGAAAVDLNGDAAVDLAVSSAGGSSISVLFNDQDGSFLPRDTFPAGSTSRGFACGDWNGDGDIDLAVTAMSATTVSVLPNLGAGQFGPPEPYATGTTPWGSGTADLNGDGALDLIVANYGSSSVSVLLATGLGIAGPSRPGLSTGIRAWPNPFRTTTAISLQLTADSPNSIEVFDASGRRVRVLAVSRELSAVSSVLWDATDARGRRVSPGIYFIQLEGAPAGHREKIVFTR